MTVEPPLSTLLSQVLVAHTVEVDDGFEQWLVDSGQRARVVSLVMWSNFLRFVGDGITVGGLQSVAELPKARVLSNIGGMERWRYVRVGPADEPPPEKRDGRGSSRGLRDDWLIRPTTAGLVAREAWPMLIGEIEERWRGRFGGEAIDALVHSSQSLLDSFDLALPEYVPVIASTDGFVVGCSPGPRAGRALPKRLAPLLAQTLLAYTLDFERASALALPLVENVIRVTGDGIGQRDIPAASGISKEATNVALTALTKSGHAAAEGRTAATRIIRLTASGEAARSEAPAMHASVENAWTDRVGAQQLASFRRVLEEVLDHPNLVDGLRPHSSGWRASRPYLARTQGVLRDPRGTLPHYPMVLHRGGWPDGS